MIQVRQSMFETNSSSSNTLILLTESEYASWKNEELFVEYNSSNTMTAEQIEEAYKAVDYYEDATEYRRDNELHSYEEFREESDDAKKIERNGMVAISFDRCC